MIEAHELTKRYGDTTAVHSLSFTIAPGTVTGFLGPNGAGKSTTMRMIMGLDRPTSGTVIVNGEPYRQHRAPLQEVGALLEASAVHPGRSARSHLRTMAATHNIKATRVNEVIEMTGLAGVATKRVGGFSLGMGQRLGIAAGPIQQVINSVAGDTVRVRSPQAGGLATALTTDGATVTSPEPGTLEISGTTTERVGEIAFNSGLLLHELSPRRASLEEAYMSLKQDAVENRTHTTTTSRTEKAENR